MERARFSFYRWVLPLKRLKDQALQQPDYEATHAG